jgi:hypothetical protein
VLISKLAFLQADGIAALVLISVAASAMETFSMESGAG